MKFARGIATPIIPLIRGLGGASPPPTDTEILTRSGDTILTRAGDTIIARAN